MKIDTTINEKQEIVITLQGRLDANSSKELSEIFIKSTEHGYVNILINCKNLEEMSSAGLDFLIKNYKKFNELHGRLSLTNTSYELEKFLNEESATSLLYNRNHLEKQKTAETPNNLARINNTVLKYYKLKNTNQDLLEAFGNPDKFYFKEFSKEEPFLLRYSQNDIGLGLGAMSYDVNGTKDNFSEFLNIGEYTFHIPPNKNAVPDYQKINGKKNQFYKIHSLYGLRASNSFAHYVKFNSENASPLKMSSLIYSLMEFTSCNAVSFVICGKLSKLSSLRLISPMFSNQYNDVFNKASFDKNFKLINQDKYKGHTALLVGFAINQANVIIKKFLKPYASHSSLHTHIHALIFDRGTTNFSQNFLQDFSKDATPSDIISLLIKKGGAVDLCHLINDEINNMETCFLEGICYFNILKEFRTGEF
ncbi:MAG: STAS domain-containing protein [Bdellovibrionota bacterium]